MTSDQLKFNKEGMTPQSIGRNAHSPGHLPFIGIRGPAAPTNELDTTNNVSLTCAPVESVSATTPSEDKSSLVPVRTDSKRMPNILLFGETGTGKSSLINMIAGNEIAEVSNDALGCTFGNVGYSVDVDGTTIKIWDTAGLNEGEHGSISAEQARNDLQSLMQQLADGVDLLVYCIRGTRYRNILQINYDIFSGIIFQGTVPIVIVITGLEHQDPMDSWWTENESEFTRRGMTFAGHACVTTTMGKLLKSGGYMFEEEYAESKKVVRKLIMTHIFTAGPRQTIPPEIRMNEIMRGFAKYRKNEQRAIDETNATGVRPERSWGILTLLRQIIGIFMSPIYAEYGNERSGRYVERIGYKEQGSYSGRAPGSRASSGEHKGNQERQKAQYEGRRLPGGFGDD